MANERVYVLITPAKNEQANIERLIEAVLAQTVLPRKWVIVDDGSTDRTGEIVASYAERNPFIQMVTVQKSSQRDFASKAHGFSAGFQQLSGLDYDFVGNLDADVSFAPDYFERLLGKFSANPRLGIAGGIILERVGEQFIPQRISSNSVAGAVQLFRAQCFLDIGGYVPLRHGGIDAVAEIMARMHGWTVRTIAELSVRHYRRVSTGKRWIVSTRFQQGKTSYLLGYHPVFQTFSSLSRLRDRPFVIGSLVTLLGYFWAAMKRQQRGIPDEVVRYLRSEQVSRLGQLLGGVKPGARRPEQRTGAPKGLQE
jgi:biofilm PGA synthesis N-glycosyltransferase PgaC